MKLYSLLRLLLAVPLIFTIFIFAPGCESREQIQSYTVPKEKEAEPPAVASAEPREAEPPETGEPTHRMLAAILPDGDRAWFFKLVGPLAAVDRRAEEVHKFFTGIRLGDDGRPTWELPAEWKEEQGGGMRAATIWIPADGERLELSVIPLPWGGTPGDLLSNINRWRGQMKLPEASREQLAEFTREIQAGDATMTIVDLRGRFDAGAAMMPPFARGAPGQPGQVPQLPPGHPPINGERDGDR
jgi:hypothetical protein